MENNDLLKRDPMFNLKLNYLMYRDSHINIIKKYIIEFNDNNNLLNDDYFFEVKNNLTYIDCRIKIFQPISNFHPIENNYDFIKGIETLPFIRNSNVPAHKKKI